MSKAEQIFKTADFSVETDLKERLRKQLFENGEITLSEKGLGDSSDKGGGNVVGSVGRNAGGRRSSARQLSFDELDLVNAAGNIAMQQDSSGRGKAGKAKDSRNKNPWNSPFSGNLLDNDKE